MFLNLVSGETVHNPDKFNSNDPAATDRLTITRVVTIMRT